MPADGRLLVLMTAVHLLGAVVAGSLLLFALRSEPDPRPPDVGGDDGRGGGPESPPASPRRPAGDLPLPDAGPARTRLREPGRLGAPRSRPPRRPSPDPPPDRRSPIMSGADATGGDPGCADPPLDGFGVRSRGHCGVGHGPPSTLTELTAGIPPSDSVAACVQRRPVGPVLEARHD